MFREGTCSMRSSSPSRARPASSPPAQGRIELRGPSAPLTAKQAQTLAMAFHELATNAAKYGALSNETGAVRISWT